MNSKCLTDPQEAPSIEELERTLAELRSAVRASNPLLKAVASSSLYPALSLILGTIMAVFCLAIRAETKTRPFSELGVWPWIFLAAVFTAGGLGKVIIGAKLAAKQGGRSFYVLMTAIYGGKAAALLASSAIAIVGGVSFLVSIHQSWYIVPIIAIYAGLASHALDLWIDLAEYRVLGWVSLAAGVISLFFIQTDPLLWTALVTTAVFIVFGVVGLLCAKRREAGKRA